MRLFGFEITRTKQLTLPRVPMPIDGGRGGWWPIIREPYTGAWQRNEEIRVDSVLTYTPLFRCISMIAGDIAKMRVRLVAYDDDGIWAETDSPAFSPVLRKPNSWQNRIQFFAQWMESKLAYGNAYVLKQRDQRGVVVRLTVLDPTRVTVLVSPAGDVFYELRGNFDLAGLVGTGIGVELAEAGLVRVPAREVIHDRWNTFFHPLIGLSPIWACGQAAVQGLNIQNNSSAFFGNGAKPSGLLTAPGAVDDGTAKRLKAFWETEFSGSNSGKTAVLGDGLKYESIEFKAVDAQLVEQAKWSAEVICMAFGVPAHKLSLETQTVGNVEALNLEYYSQCLQIHIEQIELCLDEGLELPWPYETRFELNDLLRMDTATLVTTLAEGVKSGIMAPDEARFRLNLSPVKGGATPYLQQQNFSLAALDKRDRDDPFAKPAPAPAPMPAAEDDADDADDDAAAKAFIADLKLKAAGRFAYA